MSSTANDSGAAKKKAATVISVTKLVNKEYVIKEADQRMLRELKCQFVLRIDDSGAHAEVIVPRSRFATIKDKPTTVPLYDYKAAIGFLSSISAAAFSEAKDDTKGEVKSALLSLITSGVTDYSLTEKTIGTEGKVKKLGLYLLKANLLANYIERLPEGPSNVEHTNEVCAVLLRYLRAIPSMVKKNLGDLGIDKINVDAPVPGEIPAWLHGKIVPYPLPKDLYEEEPIESNRTKFVFGKVWTSGMYLTFNELHLSGMEALNTLDSLVDDVKAIGRTLPSIGGIMPLTSAGVLNFQNKYVKEFLEKKRFSLPPKQRVAFEATRDDKTDSAEPALAKAQLALRTILRFRAGELEHRVSARPAMAIANPRASLELMCIPDYNDVIGNMASGKDQNVYKEAVRERLFTAIQVMGTGGRTRLTYDNGWVYGPDEQDRTALAIVGSIVGMSFQRATDAAAVEAIEVTEAAPATETVPTEAGTAALPKGAPRATRLTVATVPVLVTPAPRIKTPPELAGKLSLPDTSKVEKESDRLKAIRKPKRDKLSTTAQGFMGFLKMYNPQVTDESLAMFETNSSVPGSIEAQITAAKLFPAARTLATASNRAKFHDPGAQSDGSESD